MMRRYTVTVNNKTHEIDVEETSADTFQVQVGGKLIDVRINEHLDLAQAAITPNLESGKTAQPAALVPSPTPDDPDAVAPLRAPVPAAPPSGAATAVMTAPMPGVILSVSAKPGSAVNAGDELMVLEAMKMKNALRAVRSGTVAEIFVAANQQVKYGEPLLRYEEN